MGKEFARSEGIRVQVTNEQAQQIRKLYKELSDEYKERLRILSTKQTVSARIREQYLKDYVKDLERDMQYLNNNLENTIISNMLRVAEAVVDDSIKLDKEMGFGGIMTKQFYIPQDVVAIVTSGELYKGKWSLSGAIWSTNQKQLNDINSVVAKGIAGNKSAYEIAKDLERYVNPNARKDWNWSKVYPNTNKKIDYNAQRLARTMVAHAYQESFVESTKDNPFIESYRWLASGGDRMCPICAERDGQIYSKDDLPMDHPNGMCTFEVVIEKSYEEIGRELADWVNGEGDPELNAQIDNYADSLGLNVKQMTAGTEQVRKAEEILERKEKYNADKYSDDREGRQQELVDALGSAYEYHRVNNGLSSTPLSDLGGYVIKVNYSNLSPETEKQFTETIARLIAKYDTPLTEVRTMTKEEAVFQFSGAFATTAHNYSTDSAQMLINPSKCKDYEKMTNRLLELMEGGYAVKIDPARIGEYVPTHEFAHTLINMEEKLDKKTNWVNADYEGIKSIRKEVEEVYARYLGSVKPTEENAKKYELDYLNTFNEESAQKSLEYYNQLEKVKLGDYSMTNSDEFFAEAFTQYTLGNSDNEYVREIGEIVERHYGK